MNKSFLFTSCLVILFLSFSSFAYSEFDSNKYSEDSIIYTIPPGECKNCINSSFLSLEILINKLNAKVYLAYADSTSYVYSRDFLTYHGFDFSDEHFLVNKEVYNSLKADRFHLLRQGKNRVFDPYNIEVEELYEECSKNFELIRNSQFRPIDLKLNRPFSEFSPYQDGLLYLEPSVAKAHIYKAGSHQQINLDSLLALEYENIFFNYLKLTPEDSASTRDEFFDNPKKGIKFLEISSSVFGSKSQVQLIVHASYTHVWSQAEIEELPRAYQMMINKNDGIPVASNKYSFFVFTLDENFNVCKVYPIAKMPGYWNYSFHSGFYQLNDSTIVANISNRNNSLSKNEYIDSNFSTALLKLRNDTLVFDQFLLFKKPALYNKKSKRYDYSSVSYRDNIGEAHFTYISYPKAILLESELELTIPEKEIKRLQKKHNSRDFPSYGNVGVKKLSSGLYCMYLWCYKSKRMLGAYFDDNGNYLNTEIVYIPESKEGYPIISKDSILWYDGKQVYELISQKKEH